MITRTLRIAVRGESEVAAGGCRRTDTDGLRLAYLASPGDVRLRAPSRADRGAYDHSSCAGSLASSWYGEEDARSTSSFTVCSRQGATLGVAESLTGGQLGETLTRMAGSSTTFVGGVVAYETRLKTSLLGVDPELLDREGPVHPDVARQLADGVRRRLGSTYGLSTTGVAGPEPADGHDPGTVYIAASGPTGTKVRELRLGGTRDLVRTLTVVHALDLLHKILRAGNNA